jgi:hypothetical protein
MGCPSLNQLFDFARERMSAPERETIMTHLATGCPRCQENQRWLAEVLRLTAEDKSFDFPEEVIARVVAWMRPRPVEDRMPLGKLIAQLVFDSLRTPQLAGVRAELTTEGAGRQMLYRADGYDIDLRFEQTEDGEAEELIGQILPEEKPATTDEFTVWLLRDQAEIGRAQTDARGIFKFERIPSGLYDLRIEASGVEINISQVGSARAS